MCVSKLIWCGTALLFLWSSSEVLAQPSPKRGSVGNRQPSLGAQPGGYRAEYRQLKGAVTRQRRFLRARSSLSAQEKAQIVHLNAAHKQIVQSRLRTFQAGTIVAGGWLLAGGVLIVEKGKPWASQVSPLLALAGTIGTGPALKARELARAKMIYHARKAGLAISKPLRASAVIELGLAREKLERIAGKEHDVAQLAKMIGAL